MSEEIQKNDSSTSSSTENELDTTSLQNSTSSATPSSVWRPQYRAPKTIKEFTSQVNSVANKVLNGEISLDVARIYSGLARVVAQGASIEVARARMVKQVPNLDMSDSGEIAQEKAEDMK